jgi:hypothetical protein
MGLNMDTGDSGTANTASRNPLPTPKIGPILGGLIRRLLPDSDT